MEESFFLSRDWSELASSGGSLLFSIGNELCLVNKFLLSPSLLPEELTLIELLLLI